IANKLTFTTQQKWSIQSAIVELEDMPARSDAEELVFNLLKAILPERLPTQTQLLPNYPNPFNPETWIPFKLSQDSTVTAKIYDVTSKLIRMIELGHVTAGNYVDSGKAIYWDGRSENGEMVASGTYFYQIQAGDYTDIRKMVILK
ncbi:MAG: FlgD immunoglobulin-like domain containing protein, partial [Candidatus Poribacteria bacterium]